MLLPHFLSHTRKLKSHKSECVCASACVCVCGTLFNVLLPTILAKAHTGCQLPPMLPRERKWKRVICLLSLTGTSPVIVRPSIRQSIRPSDCRPVAKWPTLSYFACVRLTFVKSQNPEGRCQGFSQILLDLNELVAWPIDFLTFFRYSFYILFFFLVEMRTSVCKPKCTCLMPHTISCKRAK